MDQQQRAAEARRFFFEQFVGFNETPDDAVQMIYAKAMMLCAKGDGVLHDKERAWVRGYFASTGAPDAVMQMIESYSCDDDLGELMQMDERTAQAAARNLVFDALRVCEADGTLSEDERATIHRAGHTMGLTTGEIRQVEAAYSVYKSAFQNKMAALFPGMQPFQEDVPQE